MDVLNVLMAALRSGMLPALLLLALPACSPPAQSDRDPTPPAAEALDGGAVMNAAGLATADIARGERLSLACIACHTLGPGEADGIGPNLGGMFGSPAASGPSFGYSAALREAGLVWTPEVLDAWLAAPSSMVPGTSMVFAGYAAPSDRRDLIAYLLQATGK